MWLLREGVRGVVAERGSEGVVAERVSEEGVVMKIMTEKYNMEKNEKNE